MKVYEKDLQKAVARFLDTQERLGRLAWCHVPNGFNGSQGEWRRMASHGAKAGHPDCTIFLKGGKTIFIELKREGGDLQPSQIKRNALLAEMGFETHLVFGKSAFDAVNQVEQIILGAVHAH